METIKRTKISDLLGLTTYGAEVNVKGWVRTRRGSKQVAFVAGGLGIAYGFSKIPLGVYRSLSYIAFWISVGLMVYTLLFGVELNGAKRWMRIGPLQFQTTEIIKITIPLYLARVLETCSLDTFKEYFRKILIPLGIAFALILLSSVSAALFVAILSFGILFM